MAAPPAPDAVLHLAALHTLAATGFASTSRAASMTLSTVMAKYLRLVATTCVERANLAGRNKVAALDVVDALEDLGVRVGELYEWAEEHGEVSLGGEGLGGLEDYLRDGLSVDEGLASLKLVPEEELLAPADDEEGESGDEDAMDEDEPTPRVKEEQEMDVDVKVEQYIIRTRSPDLSWLPPLPTSATEAPPSAPVVAEPSRPSSSPSSPAPVLATPPQSIAERYRRPIPYASSQLSQSHPFHSPTQPAVPPDLPASTTSLPNLITTYHAIASDPSVSLRQNDLRRQATEILRRNIAPVEAFSPRDTLTTPIPPVRASPIVPSHSDTLPTKLIPVNPRPDGVLSSLVGQIASPFLPPALRERLVGLRPPQAQQRNGEPLLYGPAVRGPDDAALDKAKGKHLEGEHTEAYLSRTWNSGPRGGEKFGRGRLPGGKKVVCGKDGEPVPREPEQRKRDREEDSRREAERDEAAKKVTLRLPSAGPSPTPPAQVGPSAGLGGVDAGRTTPGGTLKIKIGGGSPLVVTSPGAMTPASAAAPPAVELAANKEGEAAGHGGLLNGYAGGVNGHGHEYGSVSPKKGLSLRIDTRADEFA
ncbi:hypothetical protein IAT38_006004 [Cryptococcus sp. DSM 104549]